MALDLHGKPRRAGEGGLTVTCKAEIRRRYDTRDEAWGYLASRGFNCSAGTWQNGRWAARVERGGIGFDVMIWLRRAQEI